MVSSIFLEYNRFSNKSTWPNGWSQTRTITPGQTGPEKMYLKFMYKLERER